MKSEYQNNSGFDFLLLQNTVDVEMLPFQEMRCVTILIP